MIPTVPHRLIRLILNNSLLLLAGTVAAVIWANIDVSRYEAWTHPLQFWVNDVGMVFFFALAAKEVFEATMPGGALASPRHALTPLAAAIGGMITPAVIYVALAATFGPGQLIRGWAIPCATDIAFSAMVARVIFPAGHPAIPFLLLLAIADDAVGLIILAAFYPSGPVSEWMLIGFMGAAIVLALWLRSRAVRNFWPYVIGPGVMSWVALYLGGVHPALALVPIVPFIPHAVRDPGSVEPRDKLRDNALDEFGDWWAAPVQVVLLLFGFVNAGVPFGQIGPGTFYVLAALLLGKPAGIMMFSRAARVAGGQLPAGLRESDLLVTGIVAAIGFTVSLFFATTAFPGGSLLAETKMGALLSFIAAPMALLLSRVVRARSHAIRSSSAST